MASLLALVAAWSVLTPGAAWSGDAAALGAPTAGASRVTQRIVVSARSYKATRATFVAIQWKDDHWERVFGPWTAYVGYNGIAKPGIKREGDGKTPSGTYGFQFFFGVQPNPKVAFSYRRAHRYDVWDDDPASPRYNEWVDQRQHDPGARPEPMYQQPVYNYAAVIAYNTGRAPGRGSAIFLHVSSGSATAGCVSLPQAKLLRVLRWLSPHDRPKITIQAR